MANVRTTFTSDDRDVQKTLEKMHRQMIKLREENKRLGQSSRKSAEETKRGFRGVASSIISAEIATQALQAGFRVLADQTREVRREAELTAVTLDKSNRKLRIQAGLNAIQGKAAQQQVAQISALTGVDQVSVNRIATEAVSQGFQAPLKSGTVDSVVSFLQSTGTDVESADLESLVGGVAKQLNAEGKKLSGENAAGLLLRVRGLFKSTPLQAGDLPDFSKAAFTATKAGVNQETFLSGAAILKQSFDAAEGSTGFKNTLLKLTAPEQSGIDTLQKIGLKPEDVDLIGETLPQALQRLGGAIDQLPKEQQLPALKGIFGQKTLSPALALVKGAQEGQFKEFAAYQRDVKGFAQGVQVARGGLAAGIARGEAEKQEEQRKFVERGGITLQEFDAEFKRALAAREVGLIERLRAPIIRQGFELGLENPEDRLDEATRQRILKRRESEFSGEQILGPGNEANAQRILGEIRDGIKEQNKIARQNQRGAAAGAGANRHNE